MLKVSDSLSLPIEAATARFVALGKSGSGKTNAGVVLAEELVGAGVTVAILDVLGNMHGLRAAGDGDGLPIAILGGMHGDVPVRSDRGAVVADLVASGVSAVVDLSTLTREDAQEFAADFFARLVPAVRASGRNVHVIVEEAESFAPQLTTSKAHNAARAAATVFARTARNVGIGWTFSTQRPQLLSKDVIDSSTAFLAMKMTGDLAQAAIGAEATSRAGKKRAAEIVAELPRLARGEAWLVPDPDWLGDGVDAEPEKFRFRWRRTFDSARPPKVGERREEPRMLADVDLAGLRAAMAEDVAKSPDFEISQSDNSSVRVERVEVPVLLRSEIEDLRAVSALIVEQLAGFSEIIGRTTTIIDRLTKRMEIGLGHVPDLEAALVDADRFPAAAPAREWRARQDAARRAEPSVQAKGIAEPPVQAEPVDDGGWLPKGIQLIVDALAQRHPKPSTRVQVGLISGYSPRSSTFETYVARARALGLLEIVGKSELRLTAAGRARTAVSTPRTSEDVLKLWLGRVGGGERKLLAVLVDAWPTYVSRLDLAKETGYSATSSTFETYISRLRALGLAEIATGKVRATDELFPTGRPR